MLFNFIIYFISICFRLKRDTEYRKLKVVFLSCLWHSTHWNSSKRCNFSSMLLIWPVTDHSLLLRTAHITHTHTHKGNAESLDAPLLIPVNMGGDTKSKRLCEAHMLLRPAVRPGHWRSHFKGQSGSDWLQKQEAGKGWINQSTKVL